MNLRLHIHFVLPIVLLCLVAGLTNAQELILPKKAEVQAYLANWEANMQRVSGALEKYRELAETGSVEEVVEALDKEAGQAGRDIQWKALPRVSPTEINALKKNWFVNYARSFLADNAIYASNEDLYVSHEARRILFSALLDRDEPAALGWLAQFKESEEPTLFDAIMCGEISLREKNAPLLRETAKPHWKAMMTGKNPALAAAALQLHRADDVQEDDLSTAITSALGNEWLSLHGVALDASQQLSPARQKEVVGRYLRESKGQGSGPEQLREKARALMEQRSSVE